MEIMQQVVNIIEELKRSFTVNLNTIETGTIRSYHEKHESTRHIAKTLENRGTLISVDIDANSLKISKDICKNYNNIKFIESDSHSYLKSLKDMDFHFALLDSVNDKNFIMEEFRLIIPLMNENGIIVIDDAGILPNGERIDESVPAEKGHAVWEFLYQNKIEFSIVETPLGHGTQIIVRLNRDKLNKIKTKLNLTQTSKVSISANIMLINEEFWIQKQLEYIYDFFDEIVICEGCELKNYPSDIGFNKGITDHGFSTDRTREIIENFPDPENKIKFITQGFCNDKVQLSQQMYEISTGDYVWQIDCDEFYTHNCRNEIKDFLTSNKDVNQINFRMYHFIDFNNCIHGENGKSWGDNIPIRRVFRKETDNNFISHRPPTINYRTPGRVVDRDQSLNYGWVMHHYGYVFDWQVNKKANYYPDGKMMKRLKEAWKKDHTLPLLYGSKTEPFKGKHPEIIERFLKE